MVELLTGKPPYFDMAPMSALFRIVQDDHPPLPDGVSEVCRVILATARPLLTRTPALPTKAARDFMLQCFHKEPALRKTAAQLLKHPWVKMATQTQSKAGARMLGAAGPPAAEGGSPPPPAGGAVGAAAFHPGDDDSDDENWDVELGESEQPPLSAALSHATALASGPTTAAALAPTEKPVDVPAAAAMRALLGEGEGGGALGDTTGLGVDAEPAASRSSALRDMGVTNVDDLLWEEEEEEQENTAAAVMRAGGREEAERPVAAQDVIARFKVSGGRAARA